jgi:hypothetical protein
VRGLASAKPAVEATLFISFFKTLFISFDLLFSSRKLIKINTPSLAVGEINFNVPTERARGNVLSLAAGRQWVAVRSLLSSRLYYFRLACLFFASVAVKKLACLPFPQAAAINRGHQAKPRAQQPPFKEIVERGKTPIAARR